MKFRILSDLHVNFEENLKILETLSPNTDDEVLLIAGDSRDCYGSKFRKKLFHKFFSKWKTTIEVPGNHNYYGMNIDYDYREGCMKMSHNGSEHWYVNNDFVSFEKENVVVIGSTLWSNVPYNKISTFNAFTDKIHIGGMNIDKYNCMFQKSLDKILNLLEKYSDKQIIMLTHHVPLVEIQDLKFQYSNINDFFVNNLRQYVSNFNNIKYWIHGHSHDFKDMEVDGVRYIRNPLGYYFEHGSNNFNSGLIIEL